MFHSVSGSRDLCLTLPLAHHCGDGKKRSENDNFIIFRRDLTGGAPRSAAVLRLAAAFGLGVAFGVLASLLLMARGLVSVLLDIRND